MADFGLSFNPIGAIDALTDFSGNQSRADRAYADQAAYNQRSEQLDNKKYQFSREQYLQGMRRDDNKLQRLVADANKAGVSISTALGAAPSSPVQVSIPGHGTRRAGTANAKAMPQSQMSINPNSEQTEAQKHLTVSALNQSRADADYAFYRMLNEKGRWEKSRADANALPELPNRYEFYRDNTKEAIEHYQKGGYVLPSGASMELPETLGGYNYFRPYVKQNGKENHYKAEDYYYNDGLGIAP